MACKSYKLTTIQTSCGSNIPSIKKMWIGQFESVTPALNYVQETVANPDYDPEDQGSQQYIQQPYVDPDGNKVIESITGLTLDDTKYDYWVEFQFRKNTCSASTEMTINDNGTHYFTNALNMVLAKQDTAKRLNIQSIASGDCACIYMDGNGKYWMIGLNDPVTLTSASANTGTAVGDSNQYELVLSEDAATMPIEIVGAEGTPAVTPQDIVDGLLEPAADDGEGD